MACHTDYSMGQKAGAAGSTISVLLPTKWSRSEVR